MRFIQPQTTNPEAKRLLVDWLENIAPTVDTEPIFNSVGERVVQYDLIDFIDDLCDLLTQYKDKTDVFKDFSFAPEFTYALPTENEQNAFRYSVVERTDATTEQGALAHQGRKNYRWTLYKTMEDLQNPGYAVLQYVKPMDNTIDLVCWSKNYRDANKAAFEIENLLSTFEYVFRAKGLNMIRFNGRQEDLFHERNNIGWFGCPLRYFLKTYKTKLVYEKVLEEIVLELLIKNNN